MPKEIQIKGNVVDDETGFFYDYFGLPSAHPSAISNVLNAGDPDDEVIVSIASNGGDVFAASEIYTLFKNYTGLVTVNIQGLAASAASVVAMAGDKVNISPVAQIMIHKASSVLSGNADDLQHTADVLSGIDQSIAAAYESKTGMTQNDILQLMTAETWLTAQQAVDNGFADQIMFVDDKQPVVTNSIADIPSKRALNKFMNLIATDNNSRVLTPAKTNRQQSNRRLMNNKLAILLDKKEAN